MGNSGGTIDCFESALSSLKAFVGVFPSKETEIVSVNDRHEIHPTFPPVDFQDIHHEDVANVYSQSNNSTLHGFPFTQVEIAAMDVGARKEKAFEYLSNKLHTEGSITNKQKIANAFGLSRGQLSRLVV
jgi:hypothetical protein